MDPVYTWDSYVGGFACFKGERKLAVYWTHSDNGLFRNGVTIYEAVPPSLRRLHFTSSEMSVDDVRAIIDSLPEATSHPHELTK